MKLMFLFASENLNQAFKRFQYFKQYSKYRKKQADQIIIIQIMIQNSYCTIERSILIITSEEKIKNINIFVQQREINRVYPEFQILLSLIVNFKLR